MSWNAVRKSARWEELALHKGPRILTLGGKQMTGNQRSVVWRSKGVLSQCLEMSLEAPRQESVSPQRLVFRGGTTLTYSPGTAGKYPTGSGIGTQPLMSVRIIEVPQSRSNCIVNIILGITISSSNL